MAGQPPTPSTVGRLSRRSFLAATGATGGYLAFGPGLAAAFSGSVAKGKRPVSEAQATVLVTVFLRGAADGLNIVVPHRDPWYVTHRRKVDEDGAVVGDITIDTSSMPPLSDDFTFNPDATALQSLYDEGDLLVVQAAGLPQPNRSHFAAMDHMDYAFADEGWLHNATSGANINGPHHRLSIGKVPSPSLNSASGQGLSLTSPTEFLVDGAAIDQQRAQLESMYVRTGAGTIHDASIDQELAAPVAAGLSIVDVLSDSILPEVSSEALYPAAGIGADLAAAAQLIKADIGCRALTVDIGGWDHHINELDAEKLPALLTSLSEALAAFRTDLGPDWARTVVVVVSEFGRRVAINGGFGTDHGYGNVMFLLGGSVLGGRVYLRGGWPGLAPEHLHDGQDLWVTTDFRDVYAEALRHQFGAASVAAAFGSYPPTYLDVMGEAPGDGIAPGPTIASVTDLGSTPPSIEVSWEADGSGVPPWAVATEISLVDDSFVGPPATRTSVRQGSGIVELPDEGPTPTMVGVSWSISGGGNSQWTYAPLGA